MDWYKGVMIMSLTDVSMGIYVLMIHQMIDNIYEIILAYLVAFKLGFTRKRPL